MQVLIKVPVGFFEEFVNFVQKSIMSIKNSALDRKIERRSSTLPSTDIGRSHHGKTCMGCMLEPTGELRNALIYIYWYTVLIKVSTNHWGRYELFKRTYLRK